MTKKNMSVEELVVLPKRTFRFTETDPATVAEYAGLMEQGIVFPPLVIAEVGKTKKRVLVGGFHRLAAATKAKVKELPVVIASCKAAIDADVLAFTDNVAHGLGYTADEKRKAILELLQTPSFAKVSSAAAAKRLGVSDMSIKRYRDAIGTKSPKAGQSGHKNKKSNVAPKVDAGGKVVQADSNPVRWKIQGAKLGGGAEAVASAIIEKVCEGTSPKSPEVYRERISHIESIAQALLAFCDGARQSGEVKAA